MFSLRQLLADHSPALLLDAASARIQVGWIDGTRTRWETSDREATVGVFECVQRIAPDPLQAAAFLFCEGPGSILGIRTVAMALRTWRVLAPRPVFAYDSLAIVAHALGHPEASVIADARRETWHQYRIGHGLRRVPAGELAGELFMPEHFRHWSPAPPGVRVVPYELAELLPRVAGAPLFFPTDAPDAFLHEEPSYATWTPQIHRGPRTP